MHTLHIYWTGSSAADGDKFVQTLADDGIDWLQSLTIANEFHWFRPDRGGSDGLIDSLVTLIARQRELAFLNLSLNGITKRE